MKIGMPATLYLHDFGALIWDAFGKMPYHVGSSLKASMDGGGEFRDVDIRLILDDEEFAAMFGADCTDDNCHENAKWVATIKVWTAYGEKLTGLPIDFQIQRMSDANNDKRYPGPRSAIGRVPAKICKESQ